MTLRTDALCILWRSKNGSQWFLVVSAELHRRRFSLCGKLNTLRRISGTKRPPFESESERQQNELCRTVTVWRLRPDYGVTTRRIISMSHLDVAGWCAEHQKLRIDELIFHVEQSQSGEVHACPDLQSKVGRSTEQFGCIWTLGAPEMADQPLLCSEMTHSDKCYASTFTQEIRAQFGIIHVRTERTYERTSPFQAAIFL